jgi:hypothetical protein
MPQSIFKRPTVDSTRKLTDDLGFSMHTANFSFSLKADSGQTNVITTKDRNLFVTDKFSEVGILIPSRNCFGLG